MYKLDLEKAEEPEIKLSTSTGLQRKQGNSRKTPTSDWLCWSLWLCGSQQTVKNSWKDGNTWPPYLPEKPICRSRSNIKNWIWNNGLVPNWTQVCQGCILSPFLFKFYAEYIMWNAGLDESQAGIRTSRRNINNLRYADDTTHMAESEEELSSLLMRVTEDSEKVKKLNAQKTKIMASCPITS